MSQKPSSTTPTTAGAGGGNSSNNNNNNHNNNTNHTNNNTRRHARTNRSRNGPNNHNNKKKHYSNGSNNNNNHDIVLDDYDQENDSNHAMMLDSTVPPPSILSYSLLLTTSPPPACDTTPPLTTATTIPADPCHSLATPSCFFIRAAALDILPENKQPMSSSRHNRKNNNENNNNKRRRRRIMTTTTGSDNDTLEQDNVAAVVPTKVAVSSATTTTTTTTLLGRLARRFLLDQQRQQQQQQQQQQRHSPQHQQQPTLLKRDPNITETAANDRHHHQYDNAENDTVTSIATETTTTTAMNTKRKKKRKKKKKKHNNNSELASTIASDCHTHPTACSSNSGKDHHDDEEEEDEEEEDDDDDDNNDNNENNRNTTSIIGQPRRDIKEDTTAAMDTAEHNNNTATQPQKQQPPITLNGTTTTTTSSTAGQADDDDHHHHQHEAHQQWTSLVDSVLDEILVSSSSTSNNNNNNNNYASNNTSASLPLNRTLESFGEFLVQRILKQQQEQQEQALAMDNQKPAATSTGTTSINNKRKKVSNSSGNSIAASLSHNNKRKKSAPLGRTASTTTCRFTSFELTIDTLVAMCDSINCLPCRQSARNALSLALHRQRQLQQLATTAGPRPMSCLVLNARSVMPILHKHNSLPSNSISLAIPVTSHHIDDDDVDDDWVVERAFDYVALEEGTNVRDDDDGGDVNEGVEVTAAASNEADKMWLTLQLQQHETTNKEVLVLDNTVALGNPHFLDTFLRSIILACGLQVYDDGDHEEDDDDCDHSQNTSLYLSTSSSDSWKKAAIFPLSAEQFQQLCDRVQNMKRKTIMELDEIGLKLGCAQSKFDELVRTGTKRSSTSSRNNHSMDDEEEESNFEFSCVPLLRKCDEECLDIAREMLLFVRNVTRDYHGVGIKAADHSSFTSSATTAIATLHQVVENLWEQFFVAAKGLMDSLDEYHQHLADISNRDTIPQMFVSAQHRKCYRQMLDKKLRSLSIFYGQLQLFVKEGETKSKNTRKYGGASLLRFIYTTESFSDATGYIPIAVDDNDQTDELDELWGSATQQLISCASTMFRGHLSDIQTEHQARRQKLDAQQLRFFELIQVQHNNNTIAAAKHGIIVDERDRRHWQDLFHQYLTLQKQRREEDEKAEEASAANNDVMDRSTVNNHHQGLFQRITRVLFRLWSHTHTISCRLLRSIAAQQGQHPLLSMPKELKTWMSDGQMDRSIVAQHRIPSNEPCSGGGGKRRITCFLAGFIYRWLVDRCEEWNAELTEAELLTEVESSSLMDSSEHPTSSSTTTLTTSKSSKTSTKSRRKRDKKLSNTDSSPANHGDSLSIASKTNSIGGHQPADQPAQGSASTTKEIAKQDNSLNDPDSTPVSVEQLCDEDVPINVTLDSDSCEIDGATSSTIDFEASNSVVGTESEIELSPSCHEFRVSQNGNSSKIMYQEVCTSEPHSSADYQYLSSVFVVDASGSESAEDFLVGRLVGLLKGDEVYVQI